MTVKTYVSRINDGLIDLAAKTHGKVRGDIVNITGNKMKFIPNRTAINFSKVPGWGMLSGDIKKFEQTFNKIRKDLKGNIITEPQPKIEIRKGKEIKVKDEQGNQVFTEVPVVKKGHKLSDKEASNIFIIWENLPEQVRSSLTTEAFTGKLKFAKGGLIYGKYASQIAKLR